MNYAEVITAGVRSILAHKLRSSLSILGIVFGVAAVIAMLSIGEGARQEAVEQIKLMGINNVTVRAVAVGTEAAKGAAGRLSYGLTAADADKIKASSPFVVAIAPVKDGPQEIRIGDRQTSARLVGTTPDYINVVGLNLKHGRFLLNKDLRGHERVCVLGAGKALALFQSENPMGKMVSINDVYFKVIGVLENRDLPKGKSTVVKVNDVNNDVYVPLSTLNLMLDQSAERSKVSEIGIRIDNSVEMGDGAKLIKSVLRRLHDKVNDYEVIVPQELLKQSQRTQQIFNIVTGSIAGISLLVGGIGIMNIMLATVTERTREIGIRRALGADKAAILKQFLIETVVLTLSGGVIGIALGIGAAQVISYSVHWPTVVSVSTVLVSFGVSVMTGLIFGVYPARQAAEMNPIEALRHE